LEKFFFGGGRILEVLEGMLGIFGGKCEVIDEILHETR